MDFSYFNCLILIFGLLSVFQDLWSRRVRNQIIISGFFIILFSSMHFNEASQFFSGIGGFASTLLTGFIFWRFGVLGAGDIKVMAVMALGFSWQRSLEFMFYSMAWGSLLGVFSLLLDKGLVQEMRILNFHPILTIRSSRVKGHKVPFTVAIVLGLMTVWMLMAKGVFFV